MLKIDLTKVKMAEALELLSQFIEMDLFPADGAAMMILIYRSGRDCL